MSDSTPTDSPASALPAWDVGDLPPAPPMGWRMAISLIGPGVVLAGTSIGSGECLFGPAVSAQYGATLLWLAGISIVLQVFCNLLAMRYAIYCGEPLIVGVLRMKPGPVFWIAVFAVLDIGSIWPYNASNAAVPLAAAILGHLPQTADDQLLVKGLGFAVFLLAFVPLVFGGTVYRMLEKIMSAKLVLVLGYLTIVAVCMVSSGVARDVLVGFFRIGTVPQRPDTLVVGRHFNVKETNGGIQYALQGTWERDGTVTGNLLVKEGDKTRTFDLRRTDELGNDVPAVRERLLEMTRKYASTEEFFLQTRDGNATLSVEGRVVDHHQWEATRVTVADAEGEQTYAALKDVPQPFAAHIEEYLKNEGLTLVSLTGYIRENGKLPPLDWAMVVAFIAIAGAGGLTNSMFSNYARDKGWGMGRHVGAIPSAFGGITVGLSHTGRVFPLDPENRSRWRGWMRHILLDQSVWFFASVIGMALPCMMSLEFIRNASVTGDRVAAMTAEGIAERYPEFASLFWFLTLFCGFLVLAPGQVSAGDQVTRRWTDIAWTTSSRVRRFGRGEVRHIYYGLLAVYCVCGLIILWLFPALQIAKIAGVLQNIALGSSTLMALNIQRTLVPRELRPHWLLQLGGVVCGVFFLLIGATILWAL